MLFRNFDKCFAAKTVFVFCNAFVDTHRSGCDAHTADRIVGRSVILSAVKSPDIQSSLKVRKIKILN